MRSSGQEIPGRLAGGASGRGAPGGASSDVASSDVASSEVAASEVAASGSGSSAGMGEGVPGDARARSIWVQGRLRLRASSFAAIARELGISSRAVGQAMYAPNHRVEQAIASHLNLEARFLFQERYHPDGTRLHAVRGKAGAP